MNRILILLCALAAPSLCFADFSEECNAEFAKNLDLTAVKKMSKAQQDDIMRMGKRICLEKTLTELHKESILSKQKFIDKNIAVNAAYCGPSPETIGRGAQCARANEEVKSSLQSRDEVIVEIIGEEKRIKRMIVDYNKMLAAKPMPNKKLDPMAEAKRLGVAAVEKVKRDILESMKDPDSAKFRRITISPDGSMVCGEVNAKNSMGGYVGFKKFVNIADKGADFSFYEDSDNTVIADACDKQSKT